MDFKNLLCVFAQGSEGVRRGLRVSEGVRRRREGMAGLQRGWQVSEGVSGGIGRSWQRSAGVGRILKWFGRGWQVSEGIGRRWGPHKSILETNELRVHLFVDHNEEHVLHFQELL